MVNGNRTHWAALSLALLMLLLGIVAVVSPSTLAQRFRPVDSDAERSARAALQVIRAVAWPLVLCALLGLVAVWRRDAAIAWRRWAPLAGVASYLALQPLLWHWTIDDAAITFAYSENLVRGFGLVLHPAHAPEEAYSNTAWMLMLAAARWLGMEINLAAKVMCATFGAATVWLTMRSCATILDRHRTPSMLLACGLVTLGAPFVIWSSSGLEHAMQAFFFMAIVAMPTATARPVIPTALCLGALILLRPETPLVVVGTLCAYAFEQRRSGWAGLARLWPMVAIPAAVGLALLVFRLSYFGVPFPNPYYAKATTATFLRLFNVVGGGWGYVLDWLSSSAAYIVVPLLVLSVPARTDRTARLALGIVLAQFAFVLYAGGDWMGMFRFVAPALPLLAVLLASSLDQLHDRLSPARTAAMACVVAWLLLVGMLTGLQRFTADPTTPTSIVASIGKEFVSLGRRLGIEHPTLAHHDAGGTSWSANIDLIDLGGLGSRTVAQHMHDPEFMRHYLFVERKPTFVFGSSRTFAAGTTRFHQMAEFADQYVPVRFPGRAYMQADLCHVRRDALHDAPGVHRVMQNGRLVEVVVEPL